MGTWVSVPVREGDGEGDEAVGDREKERVREGGEAEGVRVWERRKEGEGVGEWVPEGGVALCVRDRDREADGLGLQERDGVCERVALREAEGVADGGEGLRLRVGGLTVEVGVEDRVKGSDALAVGEREGVREEERLRRSVVDAERVPVPVGDWDPEWAGDRVAVGVAEVRVEVRERALGVAVTVAGEKVKVAVVSVGLRVDDAVPSLVRLPDTVPVVVRGCDGVAELDPVATALPEGVGVGVGGDSEADTVGAAVGVRLSVLVALNVATSLPVGVGLRLPLPGDAVRSAEADALPVRERLPVLAPELLTVAVAEKEYVREAGDTDRTSVRVQVRVGVAEAE